MIKLRVVLGVLAVTVLAVSAQFAPASADPFAGPPICSSAGQALHGNYGNLVVVGNAYVPAGKTLSVWGNLTIAPGGCFDAFTLGTVRIGGNVVVGRNAVFGLGCSPNAIGPAPPCGTTTTNDTVGGNIIAVNALTMYLDADTIRGNVISIGGGPGPTLDPYINFPIKDNKIGGNLVVQGWQGAWFGALRNTVRGNVVITNNVGVTTGDLGTPDSTEIATNTVAGSLICFGNSPAAQIGDSGGSLNVVGGLKLGECRNV